MSDEISTTEELDAQYAGNSTEVAPAVEETSAPLDWNDLSEHQKLDSIAAQLNTLNTNVVWLCQTVNSIMQMANNINPAQMLKAIVKGGL